MNIRVTLRDPRGNHVETRVLPPALAGAFAGKFVVTHGSDPEGADELLDARDEGRTPEFSWGPLRGSVEFEPTDDPADRRFELDPWTDPELEAVTALPLDGNGP